MIKLSRDEVEKIEFELVKYETKEELQKRARRIMQVSPPTVNLTKFDDVLNACIIYKSVGFSLNDFITFQSKNRKIGKSSLTILKTNFKKLFNHYFDVNRIIDELEKNSKKGKSKDTVSKTIEHAKDLMKFFQIRPKALEEKLEMIRRGGEISREDELKELFELRQLFLASAKGELTQQTARVTYEITEVDDLGNPTKKRIYKNSEGKQFVHMEYKTTLPDAKALVGVRLIDDMITEASISNGNIISDEDLSKMFESMVMDANKQREDMINRAIEMDNNA